MNPSVRGRGGFGLRFGLPGAYNLVAAAESVFLGETMPVQKQSKVQAWIAAFREWMPTVRVRAEEWWLTLRAEPVQALKSPVVHYIGLGILALIAIYIISVLAGSCVPEGPAQIDHKVMFHVLCSEPSCRHHFAIRQKEKYDDFPVKCPKCGRETGYHAQPVKQGTRTVWVIRR
jgi:hypothetical protein